MSARVLVVDDHASVVDWLVEELIGEGYTAEGCTSAQEALARLEQGGADSVISDVEMPGMRGIDLMAGIQRERPGLPVILMTAFGSVDLAVQAVRAGACDFVTKPFSIEVLLLSVERALRERRMWREIVRLRRNLSRDLPDGIVARSPAMQRVVDRAARAARVTSGVLLTGETGAGKGTVARLIHARGHRKDHPFIQINCASLPTNLIESELFGVRRGAFTDAHQDRDGLFVKANGGTLFLDEIGEMPMEAQPKLLHVLETGRVRPLGAIQERTVDVRVIAATNRDLQQDVQARRFRADLLFRLDVIRLDIPPLRERAADIEPLTDLLLDQITARSGRRVAGLTTEALAWLQSQHWPGNVRELSNLLERAVALGDHDVLTLEDLCGSPVPAPIHSLEAAAASGLPLEQVELAYIRRVLDGCGGNMSEAARLLGIDRRTLYRRLAGGLQSA